MKEIALLAASVVSLWLFTGWLSFVVLGIWILVHLRDDS